jgi:Flp pilus assembly protein CpaB
MSPRPLLPPASRPALAIRSLRRAVRLRRRLLAGGLAAGSVAIGLGVLSPPPAPTAPVVVAAADLPGGGVLAARDLTVRDFDPSTVPAGATTSPRRLLGRVLAAPVRAGEPLTDVRVVGPGLLRGRGPGVVAAPVRIADADSVGLLRVGDRVDVLAPDPRGLLPPSTAVAGAPVVALPRPDADLGTEASGALVVLAVPAPDAAQLARHGVLGPLMISVRR